MSYHDAYRSYYKSNYKTREWEPQVRRIISVDGEGDNIPDTNEAIEPQAYTLLAFSDDRGYRGHLSHDGNRKFNPKTGVSNYGLSTVDCFEFLLSIKKHSSDLVVGFAITYDATQILRDLPTATKAKLASNGNVMWGKYRIEFTPKQSLRISDTTSAAVQLDGSIKYTRDIRVWDTFAYFQQSFVAVIEKAAEGVLDPKQVEFIAHMKAQRNNLATQPAEEVLKYCYAECEYLSIIVRDLLTQFDRIGFPLNRYYGPGPVVMKFFESIRLSDYMPEISALGYAGGMPECIPMRSYYGGRFEISQIGFAGTGYNHDINSAYPAAMTQLPCLRHGHWERTREYKPGLYGFYKVGSRTEGLWAPFPFRVGKQPKRGETRTNHHAPEILNIGDGMSSVTEGSIIYAHGGIRWVGHFEVSVALKHFSEDQIPIYDGWVWHPACKHRPFKAIADLYEKRKIAKKKKDGIEKAYKLLINSGYGKTAQGIGWAEIITQSEVLSAREGYKPPKYQCYAWAAWITSFTRAAVTDIALTHPNDVVSIATDGIISKKRVEEIPISGKLGEWDEKAVHDIWLGMPGIYTYTADGEGESEDFKRRGFSAKHFPPEYLREHWKAGHWTVPNKPEDGYDPIDPDKTMRAFVPLKQAVKRSEVEEIYGKWAPTSKELNFYPVKRIAFESNDCHDGTVVDTMPLIIDHAVVSKSYEPKQTWQEVASSAIEDADIYYLEEEDGS